MMRRRSNLFQNQLTQEAYHSISLEENPVMADLEALNREKEGEKEEEEERMSLYVASSTWGTRVTLAQSFRHSAVLLVFTKKWSAVSKQVHVAGDLTTM